MVFPIIGAIIIIYLHGKVKFGAYTSSIKINYRLIKFLNVKDKLLQENTVFMILMSGKIF